MADNAQKGRISRELGDAHMRLFINPFKSPAEWAQRSVGSVAAFCVSMISTVVYGLMVMHLISLISCDHARRSLVVGVYMAVAVGMIAFPIISLMMLRLLLRQYKRETAKNECSGGGQHVGSEGQPPKALGA